MKKIELYDQIELLETLFEGKDFISNSKQDIIKGSKGYVIELQGDKVLVEFSSNEYKDPIVLVDVLKIAKC